MTTTKLTQQELFAVRAQYPRLPPEYFAYLEHVGYGEAEGGRMIYGGPISPEEIYGSSLKNSSVVLLGDDFQGYCFGYDLDKGIYGEFTPWGEWRPWDKGSFENYVSRPNI